MSTVLGKSASHTDKLRRIAVLNMVLAYLSVFFAVCLTFIKGPTVNIASAVIMLFAAALNTRLLLIMPEVRRASLWAYRLGISFVIPAVVVLFAQADWILSRSLPTSFNIPLSKLDALYFAVATFTTTGYGDISPQTEVARLCVITQMILGYIVLAVVIVRAVDLFKK